ncbi:XRE family transcriptional regulator [Alkalilimnicola sp. S0819]|uniref:XRE family transcriptional regulator n=1 Tax=Alkalilimnicola sp. S0819 TaxID=2613922 RepID=UPI0012616D1A|nr:XRE family transcriptional regulator [Alkalilimnicola sp. S0819]KAB7624351.1 XRE family transcriptional regulator [Alkalilimnicola sp. S0819]MPQ16177.1 XRE family transcriptional regulator [Alkalilimnicola sp. S0819]
MSELWIQTLRRACEDKGQRNVGTAIGYSPAVVSQVLNGTYRGRVDLVRERVESALMGSRQTACPVLGEIPRHECLDHQARPFAATNATRVRLYRACRSCPNRREG